MSLVNPLKPAIRHYGVPVPKFFDIGGRSDEEMRANGYVLEKENGLYVWNLKEYRETLDEHGNVL